MTQLRQSSVGRFVRICRLPWSGRGVGKLVGIDDETAVVRFFDHPDDQHPPLARVPVDQVQAIQLPAQSRVYRIEESASRWQVGRVLDGDGDTLLVQFPNKDIANVPASELEVRWDCPISNPIAFLARQVTETPRFSDARSLFMKEVTRQRAASLGMSAILSSAIQLTDYQYKVVKRVLQDPVQRYLLADEVGLGKTIEAGVLIRQFLLDNPRDANVLVVAPGALVDQWRSELIRKFNLDVWVDQSLHIVASEDLVELAERMADAQMLVIDEAHHLSSDEDENGVSLFGLVSQCAATVPAMLLLSATPALADTQGFLKMLHLLDPVVFRLDDIDGFARLIDSRQLVAELIARLIPENALVMEDDLDAIALNFAGDALLRGYVERLRPIVQRLPDEDDEEFLEALDLVRTHVAETYKLHRRILRNRRRSVPWATPKRAGLQCVTYACEVHRQRHAAIEELRLMLVNDGVTEPSGAVLLRHAMQPNCETALGQTMRSCPGVLPEHIDQALRIDALSRHARTQEGRLKALTGEVTRLLQTPQAQIAVFCDQAPTADEVYECLQALLRSQVVRHSVRPRDEFEGFDPAEDALQLHDWRRFVRDPQDCRVLVCDSTAEEGLNLHGGRKIVIHFDFPASPNRVEQRMGRFDRFGSATAIESVAIACSDEPDEMAWVECLRDGFEIFEQSVASLQYLVDDVVGGLPKQWMERGTTALVELKEALAGPTGLLVKERRRIDQQDALDSLGAKPDDSFEELEEVDEEWKKWGQAFRHFSEKMLQLGWAPVDWSGNLPPGDAVFRMRYTNGGGMPTLFPLSTFITGFIGILDFDAPEASSRNPLSYPYSLRRQTAMTKAGQAGRVRPLRFGDPLVTALLSFCETDDRGRAFAVWRHWPGYSPSDACGTDLFFRFDFLVEADLEGDVSPSGAAEAASSRALRRRIDSCFAPEFITVWVGADRTVVATPAEQLTAPYRPKTACPGTGRDFNLNPKRWQHLSTRQDVPWLQDWQPVCQQALEDALAYLRGLEAIQGRIALAQHHLDAQLQSRVTSLNTRIERLSGPARQAEEAELAAEVERHKCMKKAVAHPRFHLDVAGAVFVSPCSFEAA